MAGNDKVEVRGGGDLDGAVFQNAATETTLKELVRVMTARKGKEAGDAVERMHKKAVEQNIVAIDNSTNRQEKFEQILKDSTSQVSKFSSKLTETTSKIVGGTFSFAVTAISTGLQTLVGFLTNTVDAYRDISSSGATFNGDMIEMRRAAAQANLSIEEFGAALKGNAVSLQIMGGTASEGAKIFGSVSKALRSGELGDQFYSMGMTTKQINEGLSSYISLQTRLGNSEFKDQKKLTEGSAEYLRQLDLLARVTGKQKDEIAATMEKQTKDANVMSYAFRLEEGARKKFLETMTFLDSNLDKDVADAFKDLLDGRPDTELGQALSSMSPALRGYMREVAETGGEGIQAMADRMKPLAESIKQEMIARHGTIEAARRFGGPEIEARMRLLNAYEQIERASKTNAAEMAKEQDRRKPLTTALTTLENSFNSVKNSIIDSFLGTGIFEKLTNIITKAVEAFKRVLPDITKFIDNIISGFDTDLTQNGLITAIKNLFMKIAPVVGDVIKEAFKTLIEGFTDTGKKKSSLVTEKATLERRQGESETGLSVAEDKRLKEINAELEKLSKSDPFENMSGGLTGFLTGLFDLQSLLTGGGIIIGGIIAFNLALKGLGMGVAALANPASLLGIGALTLAIIGIGKGLEMASPFVTAFGTLLEKTFTGIGKGLDLASSFVTAFGSVIEKTFNGISNVIGSMVDGFKSIPTVLNGIANVDATNIFKVGTALLTGLAPGLSALAVGGILTLISGDSIPKLANSLTNFNSIDTQKIYEVSPAIKELGNALRVLTGGDQGFLSSLGSAFTSLIKGDSGVGAFANALTAFNSVDPQKISDISPAIKELGSALKVLMGGDQGFLSSLGSAFSNLVKGDSIGAVADSFKKFNTIDSTNIRNMVNAIGDVKTTIGSDFSTQAAAIDSFRTSITNLNKELKVLADRLNDLPKESRGEAMAAFRGSQAQGGTRSGSPQPITSGSTPLEELNTSMTQLVNIARELNETNKDQLKFLKEKPGQAV